jgi:glyceraldehyde 3-phosphate dehydrogenase
MKYDSVHGRFDEIELIGSDYLKIGNDKAKLFNSRDPETLDFSSVGAEVVIECTGAFLSTESAQKHIKGSVKKLVMSAPAKDDTPTYVIGVNHTEYKGEAVISNASCTTNCLAPVVKVLDDAFGVDHGLMTTIHSYTNDQNVLDAKHSKDPRRARAAAINMIPTSTGAAKAVGLVLPHLNGKLNGYSMRVPTPDVSVVDLTATLKKSVTKEEINAAFKKAAEGAFKGLILIDNDKCVSSDFISCPYSSIFVPDLTQVVAEKMVKVVAWYDNEWGYSERLVDMVAHVTK